MKTWSERVAEMLALNADAIQETEVRNAREKIIKAVEYGEKPDDVLNYVINFALIATQSYKSEKFGEIATSEANESTAWFVLYEDKYGELLADAFLLYYELDSFTESPRSHVPEGARLHTINIFGLENDLLDDIAPFAAHLIDHGVEKIWYYDWLKYTGEERENNCYGRCDITEIIRYYMHIARNRFAYEEFKNKIYRENGNVFTMDDLKFLRKLNRLSQV